jgi:hypothetical protein
VKVISQSLKKLGQRIYRYIVNQTQAFIILAVVIAVYYLFYATGYLYLIFRVFLLLWHQQFGLALVILVTLVALMSYPLVPPSQESQPSKRKEGSNQIIEIILKISPILLLIPILLLLIDFYIIPLIEGGVISTVPKPPYCQGLIYENASNGSAAVSLHAAAKSGENTSLGTAVLNFYASSTVFAAGIGIGIILVLLYFWSLTLALFDSIEFACHREAILGFKDILKIFSYIIGFFGVNFMLSYLVILFALATSITSSNLLFATLYLTIAAALLTFITETRLQRYNNGDDKNLWNTVYDGLFYVSIFSLLAFISVTSSMPYILCLSKISVTSFKYLLSFASIAGTLPFAYTLSATYHHYLCRLAKHKIREIFWIAALIAILILMLILLLLPTKLLLLII